MNETIKRLKEMREQLKTIPADAPISEGLAHWVVIADEIIAYLPQLFTYIEELEKKVEAGKVLAEAVRQTIVKPRPHKMSCRETCCRAWDKENQAAFIAYDQAIK